MPRVIFACALAILALAPVLVAAQDGLDFEEVDDAEDIEPAEYEVVEQEFQDVARPRVVARIEVEEADAEETGAAIAAALRDALAGEEDAKVGLVFAYTEGDDTGSFYTAGVGHASRDGKGWTGDGELGGPFSNETKDEKGQIFVLIGSVLDDEDDLEALIFPLDPEDD